MTSTPKDTIELGHLSFAYYSGSKGTVALNLTPKIYNWLNKPKRLLPLNIWIGQEMLCAQFERASEETTGSYAIVHQPKNKTFPYRCIWSTMSELMPEEIPPFGAVRASAVGVITETLRSLTVAVRLENLPPLRQTAPRKTPAQVQQEVIEEALKVIKSNKLPERDDVAMLLKNKINELAESMSLVLEIEENKLSMKRIIFKNL